MSNGHVLFGDIVWVDFRDDSYKFNKLTDNKNSTHEEIQNAFNNMELSYKKAKQYLVNIKDIKTISDHTKLVYKRVLIDSLREANIKIRRYRLIVSPEFKDDMNKAIFGGVIV